MVSHKTSMLRLIAIGLLYLPHGGSAFSLIHEFGVHFPLLQSHLQTLHQVGGGVNWDPPAVKGAVDSISANPFAIASAMYQESLKSSPLETKVYTGVFLAILGDGIAQTREPHEYNVNRALSFAAFDGCYRAVQQVTYPPLMQLCNGSFLYGVLGAHGLAASSGNDVHMLAALEQTLVSQLVIIPALYYPVFYAVTGAVQGLTFEQTIQRAKDTFIPLMKRNLLFWIPVQFLAFAFVEENLQIPMLTACGLVWTIILSVVAGSAKTPVPSKELVAVAEGAGVNFQGGAYCVTGMEENCLIDPNDLFHAPEPLLTEMRSMEVEMLTKVLANETYAELEQLERINEMERVVQ